MSFARSCASRSPDEAFGSPFRTCFDGEHILGQYLCPVSGRHVHLRLHSLIALLQERSFGFARRSERHHRESGSLSVLPECCGCRRNTSRVRFRAVTTRALSHSRTYLKRHKHALNLNRTATAFNERGCQVRDDFIETMASRSN